jgi:membrane-associated phospholipid phosphatase
LLSRCKPDLGSIAQYAVGGFTNTQEGFLLVTAAICTNKDKSIMDDGFRSFPSGHASFSAAGLIYLSLYLASKLAITIPFLSPAPWSANMSRFSAFPSRVERVEQNIPIHSSNDKTTPSSDIDPYLRPSGHNDAIIAARNQSAAPPVYLLIFAIIPFFSSIYIASTRWSDFRHHGFDILFGYLIGTISAIFGFRYYHLPLGQGAGWAWGPRSRDRSFWAGVGVGNYTGSSNKTVDTPPVIIPDIESGANGEVSRDVGAESDKHGL